VSTLQRLYPPGIYEPLEALFFEATGVAQLLLAVWALRSLVEFARVSRAGGVNEGPGAGSNLDLGLARNAGGLVMEHLHRCNALKLRMIAERFGGLGEV
jgi:hypothetical protein